MVREQARYGLSRIEVCFKRERGALSATRLPYAAAASYPRRPPPPPPPTQGLICKERLNPSDPKLKLQEHKKSVAHDMPFIKDLATAVKELRPTALVGVSTQGGAFTPEILRLMAEINEHPIIFPLSNPTDLAECTFRDAVEHTDGRLAFASGSPFDPLDWHGQTLYLAQANNAYIFPAVGHAAILTQCKQIPDSIFLTAAEALAHLSSDDELKQARAGRPPMCAVYAVGAAWVQRGQPCMQVLPTRACEVSHAGHAVPEVPGHPQSVFAADCRGGGGDGAGGAGQGARGLHR